MKKLRLNKLFHWLYAFLMFYPILLFFGFLIVSAFNSSFTFEGSNIVFYECANGVIFPNLLLPDWFVSGSIGYNISNSIFGIVSFFGFDVADATEIGSVIGGLFVHWIVVSVFYLIFDVVMLPINIAHHWIDKGSDRL